MSASGTCQELKEFLKEFWGKEVLRAKFQLKFHLYNFLYP